MQVVTVEELKRIIKEAKAQGKDTSKLEKKLKKCEDLETPLENLTEAEKAACKDASMLKKKVGEHKILVSSASATKDNPEKAVVVIASTDPAKEKDFERD